MPCLPLRAGGGHTVCMTNAPPKKQRTNRVYTYLSDGELDRWKALCASHSETEAQMMRILMKAALAGQNPPAPKPEKTLKFEALITQLNAAHVQLARVGTNLNQIARQANTGLVPISRNEILAVLTSVQNAARAVRDAAQSILS